MFREPTFDGDAGATDQEAIARGEARIRGVAELSVTLKIAADRELVFLAAGSDDRGRRFAVEAELFSQTSIFACDFGQLGFERPHAVFERSRLGGDNGERSQAEQRYENAEAYTLS